MFYQIHKFLIQNYFYKLKDLITWQNTIDYVLLILWIQKTAEIIDVGLRLFDEIEGYLVQGVGDAQIGA